MKGTGMLVLSLRGVNFGFWSRFIGCSGKMSLFLAVKVSFRAAREEIKKERILIRFIYSIHINKVSFRGLHKLPPRPDWSLFGVNFKISDEHPRPFHMGVLPPRGYLVGLY